MKATGILINKDPRGVRLGELELPELGPDDALIRCKVIGICPSDIELRDGHLDAQLNVPYPIVPGHEWAGEVVKVGSNVRRVEPGDRVVGECVLAPNHWFGFTLNGAGSEMFVAPAQVLHCLPETLTFGQGAMVEPFTIAYRAIHVSGGCDAGDVVAVVGGGMIGQCASVVARAMGAMTAVIDPIPQRRELALSMGVDAVIDPSSEDAAAKLRAETQSEGADLVIGASGSPSGLASTFELARFAGRITLIGICAAHDVTAPLPLVQAKDLLVRGVTGSPGVWPRALRFIAREKIDLSPLVTKTYRFDDVQEAFAAAEDGRNNLKVPLQPA
jgi:L-iditol 2-dehydrogenase